MRRMILVLSAFLLSATEATSVFAADKPSLTAAGFLQCNDLKTIGYWVDAVPPKPLPAGGVPQGILGERALLCCLAGVCLVLLLLLFRMCRREKAAMLRQKTDPLTGIGNAFSFTADFPTNPQSSYLLYISLDILWVEKFLGMEEALEIQKYGAACLSAEAQEGELIARVQEGGFAFVMQASPETILFRCQSLLDEMNRYGNRFLERYRIHFKAGIFRLDSPLPSPEKALYYAKQGYHQAVLGKSFFAFADISVIRQEEAKKRLQQKLSEALDRHEFDLYLQFIVRADTEEILGAEALSRWQEPEAGRLMPGQYIGDMISARVIDRLDFYIFEETCRKLEAWQDTPLRQLWLFCNFTRMTVSRDDFLERFRAVLNRYDFPHSQLILELTEDTLEEDNLASFRNVMACKEMGFRIALDDLGSGYSSLSDLCDYPIDIIKIDRHIIEKSKTERGRALLDAIVALGNGMGVTVLCEGVESEQERAVAKASGCDLIQGFQYSYVLPQEEAEQYFRIYEKTRRAAANVSEKEE